MLPVTLQLLMAMLAQALNEQMARRVEYLQEEVRILKELLAAETGGARMAFTPDQRRRLALKGKALTPEDRKALCSVGRNAQHLVPSEGSVLRTATAEPLRVQISRSASVPGSRSRR